MSYTHVNGDGVVEEKGLCEEDVDLLARMITASIAVNPDFAQQVAEYVGASQGLDDPHSIQAILEGMSMSPEVMERAVREYAESFTQAELLAWASDMEVQ